MKRPLPWLPTAFQHPARLDLPGGDHLRPIRSTDVDIDYAAVMGSRQRLWEKYGEAWGWPPESMTMVEDRADLARHADEMLRNMSFNYAIFDACETELLGCVYIDPPEPPEDADAVVSWWVVDSAVGGQLEADLDESVPRWLADAWPFVTVRYGI